MRQFTERQKQQMVRTSGIWVCKAFGRRVKIVAGIGLHCMMYGEKEEKQLET